MAASCIQLHPLTVPVARWAGEGLAGWNGLGGDLGQVLEVAVGFEEQQPALVLGEVDLDVPVGHLPGVDAVVADIAHEAGELAERVRFPPAVAGQASRSAAATAP